MLRLIIISAAGDFCLPWPSPLPWWRQFAIRRRMKATPPKVQGLSSCVPLPFPRAGQNMTGRAWPACSPEGRQRT